MIMKSPSQVMAKRKIPPTVQVRVSQDVAELAQIVAAFRRMRVSDLLTEILRPILTRMESEEIAKRQRPKAGGK